MVTVHFADFFPLCAMHHTFAVPSDMPVNLPLLFTDTILGFEENQRFE
jgi:hypothetical protein